MKKWTIMAAVVGTLATCASAANTWYVAKDDPNAADTNAGTVAAPFRTIQAALDNPNCVAGDTILVKPGIYDEGGWADEYGYTNRVNIAKDNITLKSTDGAAVTHIVGAKDPSGTRGVGTAAIRCMRTDHSDIIIEGFTLRDGATFVSADSTLADGGGMLAGSPSTYLVDCVVSNCVGVRGGAMRRGTAVRCVITENFGIVKAAAGRDARFFNCLIVRNECNSGGGMITSSKLVNSTLGDFREGIAFSESSRLDNSVVSLTWSVARGSAQNATGSGGDTCVAFNSVVPYDRTVAGNGYFSILTNSYVTAEHLFLAPLFCDYRLLPGTAAVTAGDAAQLALYDIDARIDRWRDLNGEPIPQTGTIAAGCYQTPAPAPAAGAIELGCSIEIGGRKVCAHGCYAYPETYPTQWWIKAAPPEGTHVLRFTQEATDGFNATWAPMTMDDRLLLLPPPVVATTLTTSLTHVPDARYVDPVSGDDENDGLTASKPFKTLQKAVDSTTQASVIYCAAGEYAEGGSYNMGVTNRVCHNKSHAIRFVGAGADCTVIRGAPDRTSENRSDDGRGPAAIRCVGATGQCMFQGFTLADGHTSWNGAEGDGNYSQGGGVCNGTTGGNGKTRVCLTDCVITNCSATRGGAMYTGMLFRSRITDCYSTVCGLRNCSLYACLIDNNPASTTTTKLGILGPDAPTWFCTAVGRTQDEYILDANDPLTNTILVSTRAISQSGPKAAGSYVWDIKSYATNPGAPMLDPQFVDAANGNYELMASSPAAGGGVLLDSSYQYWTTGYDGYPIHFAGRNPTAGAFHCPRAAYAVAASPYGAFEGLATSGVTNTLAPGESATITYANDIGRRCIGLNVNGVLREGVYSWTYTAPTSADAPADACRIFAQFASDWYVDATNGDDANNGFTPETAKRTLADAMTNTCLLAGDTVHALPGIYDEGTQKFGDYTTVPSRVSVPANVTLISTDGPEKTIIKGADASSPDGYGRGADAVRCASLASPARLDGFTLTGGRTSNNEASDTHPNVASAAYCDGRVNSVIANCIISNNVCVRRTIYLGTCVNCRFYDNTATANSVVGRDSYLYNCVIDNNHGGHTVFNMLGIYNCTFGSENKTLTGGNTTVISSSTGPVYNTLCLGAVSLNSGYALYNCALLTGASLPAASLRTNCIVMAKADYVLDENLRPASRTSPLVDAGSNVWLTAVNEVSDALGGQRIYNGNVDIGAYEFDWRSRYAQILGSSRVEVTNASPEVVDAGSAVRIPSGASLGLTWGGPEARTAYRFTADLSGGGELTLEANGGAAACVSGVNEFRSELPVNTLGFFCSGAGYADISAFTRRTFGTMFYLR